MPQEASRPLIPVPPHLKMGGPSNTKNHVCTHTFVVDSYFLAIARGHTRASSGTPSVLPLLELLGPSLAQPFNGTSSWERPKSPPGFMPCGTIRPLPSAGSQNWRLAKKCRTVVG